jgi:hypothetical protein
MKSVKVGEIEIAEADLQQWKHHPVSKAYLKYLADFAQNLALLQVEMMLTADGPVSDFMQGEFKGRVSAISEMADPQFASIVKFYTPEGETEEEEHAA